MTPSLDGGYTVPHGSGVSFRAGEDPWWESFGSSEVNRLVERALQRGFDIREARARLDAAAAVLEGERAVFWPEVNLNAEAGSQRMKNSETGITRTTERHSLLMGASYEVDLWGRVKASAAAEKERFGATAEDFESAAMTLSATVVEAWIRRRETLALLHLVKGQLREEEALLDIEEARFVQGMASALDVLRQREVLLAMRSRLPELEASLRMEDHRLALLVAERPGALVLRDERADVLEEGLKLPALPDPGLPLELIEKRPDIRGARARLLAAGWDREAAEALRLPRLTLSAKGGLSAAGMRLIGQGWLVDAALGLSLPVFDGGRRRAEVQRTEALVRERASAYERTVLTAVKEVEDALVRENRQEKLLEETEARLEAARLTLKEALRRYRWGGDNFDAVLTARSRIRELEERRISENAGRVQARIALYRALGGWWRDTALHVGGACGFRSFFQESA